MSKQSENINFDHFKSQFEEQSNHDLGWNDPPDFVFHDAIAVVNGQKNQENKKNLFILLSLMLLGVLIGVLLFSHDKVATLEEKVNLLSVDSLSNDMSSHTSNKILEDTKGLIAVDNDSDDLAVDQVEDSGNHTVAHDLINATNVMASTTANSNLITRTNKEVLNKETKKDSKTFMALVSQLSILSSVKEHKASLTPIGVTKDPISDLEELALSIQSLESDRATFELDKEVAWVEATQKRKAEINFAAIGNFSSFTMNGEFNDPQLLTNYDDSYTGAGYKVGFDLPVSSKLRWVNSLAFNRINNESSNISSSSYIRSNEYSTSSGSTMYLMDMNIESPFGILNETMAFEVDPLLMNDGEMIKDNVSIGQHLNVFSVATGLKYSLVQAKNIDWYTSISLGGAYISRLRTQMDSEIIMDNQTMETVSSTKEGVKNLNSFYSFLELSSGVGYNLNEKFKLNIGLGYSKSLNSLRSNAQGGPSSYLHNWSTTIGISRSF